MTIMQNQLLERRLSWLALLLGIGTIIVAIAIQCGCGSSLSQAETDARWADSNIVLPLTRAVCEVETTTQPPAGFVDVACTFAEGIEAHLAAPPADAGSGLTAAADIKAPASIRMRITVPRAKQLAAAHPEVLSLPKGL